jgi:hypothetical protein
MQTLWDFRRWDIVFNIFFAGCVAFYFAYPLLRPEALQRDRRCLLVLRLLAIGLGTAFVGWGLAVFQL